jgi:hypothetical protein
MPSVTIRIYEHDGSAAKTEPVLLETRIIETASAKKLTGQRASQLLLRECPEFKGATSVMVIKTDRGWKATRTVRPTKGCSYHYIWQDVIVSDA